MPAITSDWEPVESESDWEPVTEPIRPGDLAGGSARTIPTIADTTQGGPRVSLAPAGEGIGSFLQEVQLTEPNEGFRVPGLSEAVKRAGEAYIGGAGIRGVGTPIPPEQFSPAQRLASGGIQAADELAEGVVQYLTSPQGLAETGAAMTPVAPAVYLKWAKDMIEGGMINAGEAYDAYKRGDWETFGKNVVGGLGLLLGGGVAVKHGVGKAADIGAGYTPRGAGIASPETIKPAGEAYAETVRSDTGQLRTPGEIAERSQETRGNDLEQAAPVQPEPVVARVEERPPAEILPAEQPQAVAQVPVVESKPGFPRLTESDLVSDVRSSLRDEGVTPENVEALISGKKTAAQVVEEQLGVKKKSGSIDADTIIVEENADGSRSIGFEPKAGPASTTPVNVGQMSHVDAIEMARQQGIDRINKILQSQPPIPMEAAPVIKPENYGDRLAREAAEARARENAEFRAKMEREARGEKFTPKENFPQLLKRLGRERVDELIGEWDSNAQLSPDGKFITTFIDPRNQTGRKRVPVKDFLEWVESQETVPEVKPPVPETKAPEVKPLDAPLKLSAEDKADPRMDEPGITRRSTPNSIVIQLRDLESRPIREVEIKSSGDPMTDAQNVVRRIRQEAANDNRVSLRESAANSTDANGLGILHFTDSPNGPAFASVRDLVEARKETRYTLPESEMDARQIAKKQFAEMKAAEKGEPSPAAKINFQNASVKLTKAGLNYIIGEPRDSQMFKTMAKGKLKIVQDYWKASDALETSRPSAEAVEKAKTAPQAAAQVKTEGAKPTVASLADKGKSASEMTPAERALPEGQKKMAYEASSVATVMALNRRVREKAPHEVWSDEQIQAVTGKQAMLDYIRDDLLRIYNELYKKQPTPEKGEAKMVGLGGALAEGEPAKAQLAQLTDAVKSLSKSATDKSGEAFNLGQQLSAVKESAASALNGLRAAAVYAKDRLINYPKWDSWKAMLGDRHLALSESSVNARKWVKSAEKSVASKLDQEAISDWIDSGGDSAVLQRGATETRPRYKSGYVKAQNLSPDQITLAKNVKNYFESRLQDAIDAGVLENGIEDYIHRTYEAESPWKQSVLSELRSGIFTGKPGLAKKRVFEYDFEAEKAGLKPIKSFIKRVAAYDLSLNKAIADRQAVKAMMQIKMPDGRPMIDVGGLGSKIEGESGATEATLIKPSFKPKDTENPLNHRGDYKPYDYPALRKWKWATSDEAGNPILVQGDVLVHPDAINKVKTLFERSAVRQNPIGRAALGVSSTIKQTMLDLSGFHPVQITVHGWEHRSFKPVKEIDFENPDVRGMIRGGLAVGDTRGYELFSEGLSGSSLTRHIPGIGPKLQAYNEWLFQSYIPRLKVNTGLHALERNRARYPKLSPDEVYHLTANQMNAAFGELNYEMLGRSKTTQDVLRLALLAPDFLEARGRFASQAATKYGREQFTALALGAATLYITARIINKLLNDEYHFETKNAFNVVHNGRAYSLRTVQGDILHLAMKPGQFFYSRLNPVYGRTGMEALTGRDAFGRTRTGLEQMKDFASTIVPISLRGLTTQEQDIWESFLNAIGITERRSTASDTIGPLAVEFNKKHGVVEPGEFIYDPGKDPLRGVKLALRYETPQKAAQEMAIAIREGKTDASKLLSFVRRLANPRFTGSTAREVQFVKTLTSDQRKIYADALAERRKMHAAAVIALRQHGQFLKQVEVAK